MGNSTKNCNKNNSKNNQQIDQFKIKSDFYEDLIRELFSHSLKIAEGYQKIINQIKLSNSINPALKGLDHHITRQIYYDINNRKHSIKLMKNNFKSFNKNYNKKLYSDK